MTDFIEFARAWVAAHGEFLLTWLIAVLVVTVVVSIEVRRATRRAARAMSQAVATTVAACVPEIAAAAQSAHPPGAESAAASVRLDAALRALGCLSADRMQWLHWVANLRVPDTALPPIAPDATVHPLVYEAPRPFVEAHLAAERHFAEHVRALMAERRALQMLEAAEQEGREELQRIERETSAIVVRFEQANAQSEQTEVQRFLIQKFNALGTRERELTTEVAALRQQRNARAEALWTQSQRAAEDYAAMLDPLLAMARHALGHEATVEDAALWLARTRTEPGPLRAA